MSETRLDEILEATLLAAGEPLSLERLSEVFDDHERPPRRELREALARLESRLAEGALELLESASGYQLRIRRRLSPWVSRLWDERPQRYSRALLETLALIAYRQPVTRGDIEEVRGVSVSGSIMRTLSERGWIRVVGHRDVPGRPAVYATTRQFLDDFGLKTLDALPPMHALQDVELGEESGYAEANATESTEAGETPTRDVPATDAGETGTMHDPTAGTADGTRHAGTASARTGLSFADLEARLAARARPADSDADGDAGGADHPSDEMSSDS
ncbi:SMC-Scp complex subunit ScpB [Modicisalibacter tunisiensis]|uniref:SMC-Scp complex subunit ScpB n=1 Tax=Modicisalibacter tunisiensis TaxID=390637 RepID=UPI001CCF96F0|nr:SMC-Scp complex subunit ScpB [Modicisalibacter tunisiensis]MBZ9540280.1 SMC-Scp complex subunit ScpB [Modicisalibacter tunisiensis]